MVQVNGLKATAVGVIAFLSISTVAIGNVSAQETQKPSTQTEQKTEQTSACGCCKKMMESMMQEMKDRTSKMPGMNHPTSPAK